MQIRYLLIVLCLVTGVAADGNSTSEHTPEDYTKPTHAASRQVVVEGLKHIEKEEVYDALSVEYPSWFKFWDNTPPTIDERLIPTIPDALQRFFDSEGYYDAQFHIENSPALVHIDIDEGEPVRIADVNISSDFDLSDIVAFKRGERFRAKEFVETKSRIVDALLDEGYCSHHLDTKAYVDLEKHMVEIDIALEKGGVCTFGNVTVTGLETIDARIVKSRVRAEEGMRFSTEAVRETSTALYGLHAFDSVLIGVDRKFFNVVPVDITVQEMQKPYHIEAGAGYDTYVGPRVHLRLVKHNFWGNAQELSLSTAWSSLEQLARLDFYKPVLMDVMDYDIDFGASIGYSNLEYDGFREKKAWTRAFLKYENSRLRLIGGMAFESIEISKLDDGACVLPCDAYDTFMLAYPYLDMTYDRRDSKLNPKYGYYLSAYAEMGLPTDNSASLYLKTQLEARGIYTVSNLTMAVVGKIGAIDLQQEDVGIPESKKFFAGGAYSNRAYGFREIGVIVSPTEDLIKGALSMANLSLEMDYPLWGDFYGAVFTDHTMLSAKRYDYSGEIISSAGVGVRYMTPVGPFKLDVGFNTHDPSIYGISFQIGQSF